MIADWKPMSSAPKTWGLNTPATAILVCGQWNDIWVAEWNQGAGGAYPPGWRMFGANSNDIAIKPEAEASYRWDYLPEGYVNP
jgi:hypothetical protein